MPVFKGKYLSDDEIWLRIKAIIEERDHIQGQLAKPEISTDPEKMPGLARRLAELNELCHPAEKLQDYWGDLQQLEEMLAEQEDEHEGEGLQRLHGEYLELCGDLSRQIYQWLLEKGYLEEEFEDDTDLEILRFIEYVGPEYAWRLSINVNISWEEARERLDNLLGKGLLEKVQGTMLDNYHRAKDWSKHMNHTYYRLSREGKHYLRRLRNEQLDP